MLVSAVLVVGLVLALIVAVELPVADRSSEVRPWVRWAWRGTGLLVLAALVARAVAEHWFSVPFLAVWTVVVAFGFAGVRFPRPPGEPHSGIPLPLQGILAGLLIGAAAASPGLIGEASPVGVGLFPAFVPLLAFMDLFEWTAGQLRRRPASKPG